MTENYRPYLKGFEYLLRLTNKKEKELNEPAFQRQGLVLRSSVGRQVGKEQTYEDLEIIRRLKGIRELEIENVPSYLRLRLQLPSPKK
jgi:hypothetical protein